MHLYSVIIICFQYSDDTSETAGTRRHSRESAVYYVLIGPSFTIVITIIEVIFPDGSMIKNPPANAETWVQPLGREDPLEKEMAISSVSLPGKSHGQRSLVGYSTWVKKESDTT